MALTREWDDLVEQVRQLDGFTDFLRPPQLATLLPAASGGPVVVVNVSGLGCAALIVTPNGVQVRELPTVTAETVNAKAYDYLRVLSEVDHAARTLYLARQRFDEGDRSVEAITRYTAAKHNMVDAERNRDAALVAVLEWLWDAIADPVLVTLGFVEPPPGAAYPRVWWCPTGGLTLLPLHAAGYHDTAGQPVPKTVLDRVVSSYTPSLRALLHARRAGGPVGGDRRLLVVSVPDASGEVPLDSAARERDVVASCFPDRRTLLEGTAANREAVRAELPRHQWVHFICHGGQNLDDPTQGRLLLYDQPLTITDVGAMQYHGEFAFLSACMSATGGLNLVEEAITLAAAMHYSGYRHVIAAQWAVYDDTAADIAQAVYADLTSTGEFAPSRTAHALHKAIKGLRDRGNAPLYAWTPFTHTGP